MRANRLTLCSLAIVAAARVALAGSLYTGAGPRPGPDILYGGPTLPPQLENAGVWSAAPILLSRASAYRGGEVLYHDFLYHDHRAGQQTHPPHPPTPRDPV